MRALIDLMPENEEKMPEWAVGWALSLGAASQQLTILDPEVGEEELIQAVAAALAKMRMP